MYVTKYTQRNLLATDHTDQLINMILQKVVIIRDFPMEVPNIDQQTVEGPTRVRMLEKMAEFRTVANAALTVEQQRVFERLASTSSWLHVVLEHQVATKLLDTVLCFAFSSAK